MRFAALLLWVAAAACHVPRSSPPSSTLDELSVLPNLRRAGQALDDEIAREREHVDSLTGQLTLVRQDEERLYALFLQAEQEYRVRQADLQAVQAEVAAAAAALEQALAQLSALQTELAAVLAQIEAARQELARLAAERP